MVAGVIITAYVAVTAYELWLLWMAWKGGDVCG